MPHWALAVRAFALGWRLSVAPSISTGGGQVPSLEPRRTEEEEEECSRHASEPQQNGSSQAISPGLRTQREQETLPQTRWLARSLSCHLTSDVLLYMCGVICAHTHGHVHTYITHTHKVKQKAGPLCELKQTTHLAAVRT